MTKGRAPQTPSADLEHPAIRLKDGPEEQREGWATEFNGQFMTICCGRAFPPGAPVSFQIIDPATNKRASLNGKAQGSRRDKAGHFVVRLRLVVLPKPQRLLLSTLFPAE